MKQNNSTKMLLVHTEEWMISIFNLKKRTLIGELVICNFNCIKKGSIAWVEEEHKLIDNWEIQIVKSGIVNW
jgi:hypothetical protein